MSKYNKVMDNVVVTEDMRSRILQNIDEKFGDEPVEMSDATVIEAKADPMTKKVVGFRKYYRLAAAIVAVVVGGFAVSLIYTDYSKGNASYQTEALEATQIAETFDVMEEAEAPMLQEDTVDIDGMEVVLKGDGELYYSADWETEEKKHHVDSDPGVSLDEMIELVRDSMKNE